MKSLYKFCVKMAALRFLIIGLFFGYGSICLASEGSIGSQFIPIEYSLMGGYRCNGEGTHVTLSLSIGATANTGTNMSYIGYGRFTQHRAPLQRIEKTMTGHFKFYFEGATRVAHDIDAPWFDGHPMTLIYNSETNVATAEFVPRDGSSQNKTVVSAICSPFVGGH